MQAATSSHHCLSLCLFPAMLMSCEAPERSSQCKWCQPVTHSPPSFFLHKPDRPLYISGHESGFSGHYINVVLSWTSFNFSLFPLNHRHISRKQGWPLVGPGALWLMHPSAFQLPSLIKHITYNYVQIHHMNGH